MAQSSRNAQPFVCHVLPLSAYLCGDMMTTERMSVAQQNDAELVAAWLEGRRESFSRNSS
jgi:hypothetical protein